MMNNAIARIVLYTVLIAALTAVLLVGIGGNWNFSGNGELIAGSGTADPAQIRNIHIEWASGKITIHPADVTEITFSEEGYGTQPMAYQINGDTLTICYCETWLTFGNFSDKDLTVLVPMEWTVNRLELDVASADLTVENLTVTDASLDSASGAARFENCQVKTIEADVASGNVFFHGTADEVNFDAASGDFHGTFLTSPARIQFNVASGNADIILPENAGFRAEIDALSGKFTSDFPTTKDGDTYLCGNESCHIYFDGASGDLTIRKGE